MASTLPSTAKAAALVEFGKPLEFIDVPIPTDLEPGAVLVKTRMATVCGSDLHLIDGHMANLQENPFPRIPGHEMVGEVVALGPGVSADSLGSPLERGDRIIWTHGYCGQCEDCVLLGQPTVCANRRIYMSTPATQFPYLTGGFAEYCYVFPTSGRVKVPDAVPDALAAATGCALRTVVHAFDRLGTLDDRHSVVIQGSGPLGLFALAKALRSGAKQVAVIGGPASRLEVARAWGASLTIDIADVPDAEERRRLIADWAQAPGADVVVEMSGAPVALSQGVDLLRPGGRYLLVGQLHPELVPLSPATLVTRQLTLIGSASGAIQHYARGLRFLADNSDRFDWAAMISNVYPFELANEAVDRMRALAEVKPAISFL
jgi:L-iditol 2-dehydrogenase